MRLLGACAAQPDAVIASSEGSKPSARRLSGPHGLEPSESQATARTAQTIDALLDELEATGLLSDKRFVESRVHVRQAVWGERRIRHELKQHGLSLDPAIQLQLSQNEVMRAGALWQRRFGAVAQTPSERARQMRFLAGRGFSADAIRHAVDGEAADHDLPTSQPNSD